MPKKEPLLSRRMRHQLRRQKLHLHRRPLKKLLRRLLPQRKLLLRSLLRQNQLRPNPLRRKLEGLRQKQWLPPTSLLRLPLQLNLPQLKQDQQKSKWSSQPRPRQKIWSHRLRGSPPDPPLAKSPGWMAR